MAVAYIPNNEYYVGSTSNMKQKLQEHQLDEVRTSQNEIYLLNLHMQKNTPRYKKYIKRVRQQHGWSSAKKEALILGNIVSLKLLCTSSQAHSLS